ncbi:MAG: DNA polymerase IV [Eggerthellaceae bacterium]|nr:DNA polymerase IV [Eggerthellaceae bacterium]
MENTSYISQSGAWQGRAILLMDLDAFFASVEQLDHPEWRGKPVIVGGDADKRGVVSTCSYEARAYGVRSAMPSSTAARLCPQAIWTHGRYSRYREMSRKVMQILIDESPFIQQVSIDEAFLDISPGSYSNENPIDVARRIQQRVQELGVSCSIGLGTSKSVAKVASDMDKPRGLTVVYPGREEDFLANLPTKRMSGIGPVAQERLRSFGITTLGQVAHAEERVLQQVFGSNAQMMRMRCLGADDDSVHEGEPAKSVSNEISFAEDLTHRPDLEAAISTVCAKVARRLRKSETRAWSLTLKVRYADRSLRTEVCHLDSPSDDEYLFAAHVNQVLDDLWREGVPVRLLGVAASHFEHEDDLAIQDRLFDLSDDAIEKLPDRNRRAGLMAATDMVRDRFGEHSVMLGSELRTRANLTGSGTKNPEDYKSPR